MKKITTILILTSFLIIINLGCSKSPTSNSTTTPSGTVYGNWKGTFYDVGGGGHTGKGTWAFTVNSNNKIFGTVIGTTGADSIGSLFLTGTIDSNGYAILEDTITSSLNTILKYQGYLKGDTVKSGSYYSVVFSSNGKWVGKKQ